MINPDCTCPKVKCERHGKCDECRQYHGSRDDRPYCERPKFSLIRSLKKMLGLK